MKIIIIYIFMIAGFIWAFSRAVNSPVVYKDPSGRVCQCVRANDSMPSKKACKTIDMNKDLYEVVNVAECHEE